MSGLARARGQRIAVALVLVALGGALAVYWSGSTPVRVVTGRFVGPVQRVVLVDPLRGVLVEGTLESGGYEAGIPGVAREPLVVLHGQDGALVRSGAVAPEGDRLELPLLGLWESPLMVRVEDGRARFEWVPVPDAPGFPQQRRYSLLFAFTQVGGGRGEASVLARDPQATLELSELRTLLKDWDPTDTELELSLRAFDPSVPSGGLWVGRVTTFHLDPEPQGNGSDGR